MLFKLGNINGCESPDKEGFLYDLEIEHASGGMAFSAVVFQDDDGIPGVRGIADVSPSVSLSDKQLKAEALSLFVSWTKQKS